jgi:hypothetical protein
VAGEQPGNSEESPVVGGQGGELLNDPGHVRADARLARRAIEERWPIPQKGRITLLNRLFKFIDEEAVHDNGLPDNREVIAAARAILAADKINLEEQRLDLIREKMHGTEEGTIKAAQDLIAAREALDTHKAAERPTE